MAHAIPLLCEQPLGFKPKPQQFSESAVQHSTHRATRVLQRWGIQNLTWQIPDHSNNCSILTITKTRTTYKTTYFFCFKDLVQQTIWTEQAGVQTEPVHILLINVCSVLCDCVIAVLYINNMQWHCQSLYWAGTRFNRPLLQTKPSDIHSCFPFQMVWWTLPTDLICKLFQQYKAVFVVFDHLPLVLAANLMASSGTLDLQLGVWYTISCVAMWSSLVTYSLCKLFLQIQISYSCIDSLWNTYWPQRHNLMPTFLGMLKRAKLSGCTIASTTAVAAMVTNSSIKSKIYMTQSKLMILHSDYITRTRDYWSPNIKYHLLRFLLWKKNPVNIGCKVVQWVYTGITPAFCLRFIRPSFVSWQWRRVSLSICLAPFCNKYAKALIGTFV